MKNRTLPCALVLLVTLGVYLPALRGGLIWNDTDYVTKPALRGLGGLWRIWTEVGATEQYYPLLHSFFWVQHRLWGDWAAGYHLVNVLLHATSACLLALVVLRLLAPSEAGGQKPEAGIGHPASGIWTAWIAAALFAVHPVMVESVAWISEQKNTLSTVFYLWAALVYLKWDSDRTKALAASATGSSSSGTRERFGSESLTASATRPYIVASILFVFALLSKSLTASLPAALLVVIWWKRGKIERRDVIPLIPWFVAGVGMGVFSAWVEHQYIGARGVDFDLNVVERGLLSGHVIWFYLGKLFWPAELIFIYPRWTVTASDWIQWLYPIGALALAACLLPLCKRTRAPLAAYLYFVGTLVPTIGIFNVYGFKFSYVADHWVYLPSIGFIVLAAGGVAQLWFGPVGRPLADASRRSIEASASGRPTGGFRFIVPVCACTALVILLGALSHAQTRGYRDMETFYRTIIAKNPGSWLAQYNLGEFLMNNHRMEEAVAPLEAAIRARPSYADAHENLGATLLALKRPQEALARFLEVFQLREPDAGLHVNTGAAYAASGQFTLAIEQFSTAIRLKPDYADAYDYLARAQDIVGRTQEAGENRATAARLRAQTKAPTAK